MKPNTCLVVDVWEGSLEIDEAVFKAAGIAGFAIRLNDMNGGHHMDTGFAKQWAEAINFVRFPYFVYNPWVSGVANYNWLAANMPSDAHSVAIDIEVIYSGITPTAYANEVVKFLALCKVKGWKTIIYTAQWFLPYLSSWTPSVDYWWAQYPTPATYFAGVTTWDGLKIALDKLDRPFNASTCPGPIKMWQFSGDYLRLPGTQRPIDGNIFYGTEAELAAYFGQVVAPPPPPAISYTLKSVTLAGGPVYGDVTVTADISGVTFVRSITQTPPVVPPPPPPTSTGMYRIKDDIQMKRDPIRNGLPSTVRLWGGSGSVLLPVEWMKYAMAINVGKALNYQFDNGAFKAGVGWHNQGEGNRVEELTFSGNVVEVLNIVGNKAFIKTYFVSHAPPAVIYPMPETPHPIVQNFSIQYTTRLDMSTDGRYARMFIVANPGEQLWIDVGNLVKI